ncbi:hypothetical protein [Streptomyces violaceusniger]|uniref:hypothetical protein n=1 Tax=Streptomyces violaceusniger TaxID=68280 RepID=UPI00380507C0
MATKPVTLRLDEEFHTRLKARAEEMGTTVTALITEVTERELDEGRERFLEAAADFNTPENWDYVRERFGPRP